MWWAGGKWTGLIFLLQMHSNIAIKMASILYLTDSAYYPAFKSMYRSV